MNKILNFCRIFIMSIIAVFYVIMVGVFFLVDKIERINND